MQARQRLAGVLVSGDPRLLQAGSTPGWTIGLGLQPTVRTRFRLAAPPCGAGPARGKATLALFSLGVHSVIDHPEALDTACRTSPGAVPGENPDTAMLTRIMQSAGRWITLKAGQNLLPLAEVHG